MKKQELREDPVLEKIGQFIEFCNQNRVMIFSVFTFILIVIIFFSWKYNNANQQEILGNLEVDKLLVDMANNNINDSLLLDRINNLFEKFPDNENVQYLGFISNDKQDTTSLGEKIGLMTKNISDPWFKAQAFILYGDYYSNKNEYLLAEEEYQNALTITPSNTQKARILYKLGHIYSELERLPESLSYHEKAKVIFDNTDIVPSNPGFDFLKESNEIALNKIIYVLNK